MSVHLTVIGVILFLNVVLAFSLIFIERKDPTTTWAWLLIFILLPGLGFLIYIILGQNFSRQKLFKSKIIRDVHKKKELNELLNDNSGHDGGEQFLDLRKMNYNNSGARYTVGNDIDIYVNGEDKFKQLLEDIKNAKKYIHIEYYIFRKDKIGAKVIKALEEKLAEGVEVRLLVDSMGSYTITKRKLKLFLELGGKFAIFFPGILPHINTRINYRNHRKIVVIDGEYGYVGGFNVGDEYISLDEKIGFWRDTHIRIKGNAVNDLNERFLLDWCYASEEDIEDFSKFMPHKDYEDGEVGIQIVTSGPDHNEEYIKNAYLKMINNAKKNIYLTSPYFVPDEPILEAIRISALSGVDVRILIPGNPDHRFMKWAADSYIGALLKAGARVYYYENGFIHAKTLVVDSAVVSIGTANMDIRSFSLNFEVNAFIFDEHEAKVCEEQFMKDLEYSTEVILEEFVNRPRGRRIMESIIRLLAPIL
ncbi:cardiolipin synthase [Eubacterium multiforme]|uniref:Cardiolipin synthase n=1 Tax=Eubacterium multiforme TaxID=83339 RepID=A0ABT9UY63_9FIRM|nr:cardiolipin synthase [Eubacterium multiforme]MDQ0151238.1 cardiolipin synthase [Eubacterium multiforme]